MARIPDSELERLKKEVRLEDLAAGRGIELRRHGADLLDEGVPQGVPRGPKGSDPSHLEFLGIFGRCLH